jgi:hypothetical protein
MGSEVVFQDSQAHRVEHSNADRTQFFWRYSQRDVSPLAGLRVPTIVVLSQSRVRNSHEHVALRPDNGSGGTLRIRVLSELDVKGLRVIGGRGAERNHRTKVFPMPEPWRDNDDEPSLVHLRRNQAPVVAPQYFSGIGVIRKRVEHPRATLPFVPDYFFLRGLFGFDVATGGSKGVVRPSHAA